MKRKQVEVRLKDLTVAAAAADAERQKAGELEKAYGELEEKTKRLQDFQRITVGRELDMVNLKEEVNDLLKKLGKPKKYEETGEIRKEEKEIRRRGKA